MPATPTLQKTLKATMLALLLLTLTVLTVNLSVFDQESEPQLSEWTSAPQTPPVADNAYYDLLGFRAPTGTAMKSFGRARLAAYHGDTERIEIADQPDWLENYETCNARQNSGCLAQLVSQLDQHPLPSKSATPLLDRYDEIVSLRQFKEAKHLDATMPMPEYYTFLRVGKLKLAASYKVGDKDLFLDLLKTDIQFWKMLLDQGDSLLSKMFAVGGLWNALSYLSEFIAAQDDIAPFQTRINAMLLPLTKSQRDIGEAFVFEQQYFASQICAPSTQAVQLSDRLQCLVTQKNATVNSYYKHLTRPMLALSKLPAADFAALHNTAKQGTTLPTGWPENTELLPLSPTSLYNLGGKMLLAASMYSPADYVARIHDLDGMMQLVSWQLALSLQPQSQAKTSVGQLATGAPIRYDAVEHSLSFECLDRYAHCLLRL